VPPDRARIQRDFTLEPRPSLSVRVRTPDGRAFLTQTWILRRASRDGRAHPHRDDGASERRRLRFNHNSRYGAGETRSGRPHASSEDGAIATLDLFAPLPLFVSLLLSEEVIATQEVPSRQYGVVFVLDPDEVNVRSASCD
jgi:hypothetical protein